jgi:acetyl esterase/lipase
MDVGVAQLNEIISRLPLRDDREDIDTASLKRRFPHLDSVAVEQLTINGGAAPVPARLYRGMSNSGVGLVWVHGGAFVAGDLDMPESHWVGLEFAARGIPVLALDYRKALGGVHHPALSDDVLAGWLAASELLEIPFEGLHLGGASAGGNLSAGVAARLRDAPDPSPVSLVLIYPVLHSELPDAGPAAARAAAALPTDARFSPEFARAINVNYVGGVENLGDPIAFPSNGEVRRMPATLIVNAEGDDLRASGEAFAAQLADAGVAVEVNFEPGTMHGYLNLPGDKAAISTIDRVARWLVQG